MDQRTSAPSAGLFLLGALAIGLLCNEVLLGIHLKPAGHALLISLCALPVIAQLARWNAIERYATYALLLALIFLGLNSIGNNLLDLFAPDRGIVLVDGIRRRVMSSDWMLLAIVAAICSPLLLLFIVRSAGNKMN